ncbi:MAG: hypothetical protein NTX66_00705 [Candidatus Falkowbacteria bacterium]|nr:hypothetical protein [Candidatus Falkowbacteria bacterium]
MNKRLVHKFRSPKKDYQAKGLKNPFFRIKKKTRPSVFKWRFIIGLVLLILIIWFFWFSAVFAIRSVKIEGLKRVVPSNIETIVWQEASSSRYLIFKQRNIFSFNSHGLIKTINNSYNFAKLEVSKKWWSREILIKIVERPYAFIWQEGNNYYFSDKDGNLINDEPVTEDSKKQFFTLENRSANSLTLNNSQLNLNKDYLPFIFALSDKIKNYPDFKINKYFFDNELNTIKLALDGGPEIYFSTREGALDQLDKLIAVKRETIKDNFNKIKYIDLRYKDKVYYQ